MIECRVFPDLEADDTELLARLRVLPSSVISDSMERIGSVRGVSAVTRSVRLGRRRMVGHALTVRTAHGDNLVVHQALELVRPGRVLVIDAGGEPDRAIVGEIMCTYAMSRSAAGIVVGGAIRDFAELAAGELPVFAAGIISQGPYKNGPGSIGGVVAVGGQVVSNGDIVIGDADGVIVLPRENAARIAAMAEARRGDEIRTLRAIRSGSYEPTWLKDSVKPVYT